MRLEVRLFAGLACMNEKLPCKGKQEFSVEAPAGISVKGLHELLNLGERPLVTVVNAVVEKKDFILSDNDRVGIFPPIAGGQRERRAPRAPGPLLRLAGRHLFLQLFQFCRRQLGLYLVAFLCVSILLLHQEPFLAR